MFFTSSCNYQKIELEKISIFQSMTEYLQRDLCKLAQLTLLQQNLDAHHSITTCPECSLLRSNFGQKPTNLVDTPDKASFFNCWQDNYKITLDILLKQVAFYLNPTAPPTISPPSQNDSNPSPRISSLPNNHLSKEFEPLESKKGLNITDFKPKEEEEEHVEQLGDVDNISVDNNMPEENQKTFSNSSNKVDRMSNLGFKPKNKEETTETRSFKTLLKSDKVLLALKNVILSVV